MTYAETAIYYEDELAHRPEDPPAFGKPVFSMMIPNGWMSPNKMYGEAWQAVQKRKKLLREQVWGAVHAEPLAVRDAIVLREPRPRVLRLTIYQRTGPFPDPDNLVGGFKHLIDVMKRLRYEKTKLGAHTTVKLVADGIGLIWDDAPQYLRIAEIRALRPDGRKTKKNFTFVEVFEWPTESTE